MEKKDFVTAAGNRLRYYLAGTGEPVIVLIHAQGTSSESFFDAAEELSKNARVVMIDCYGHGGSARDPGLYRLDVIAEDMYALISSLTGEKITLAGHSSGGLIAACIEARHHCCRKLILEDPPFFASQGERRFKTYNYLDLSSACHGFLSQTEERDFVLYYFAHQYAWNLFPEKSREKIRGKYVERARKYRQKHPDRSLKVLFWPRSALEAFRGMNEYDPAFGEAFYTDSFHAHIDYESLLRQIDCPTVFLKAETKMGEGGIQMCALTDEDTERLGGLIPDLRIVRLKCGHGIHLEKKKEFLEQFR